MISGLDHVNIETIDLNLSVDFYKKILGLEPGWRPDFDVPGAWLYANDYPIIHLVVREKVYPAPTGAIHHLAFIAEDAEQFKNLLANEGVEYQEAVVPDLNVTQYFIFDPNGVRLEINFYADTQK